MRPREAAPERYPVRRVSDSRVGVTSPRHAGVAAVPGSHPCHTAPRARPPRRPDSGLLAIHSKDRRLEAAFSQPRGDAMNELWLVRHGATEWSKAGRHTSSTDLPLLPEGEEVASGLGERLRGPDFTQVLTSPLRRARRTAELAGHADAEVDDDLAEWGYGDYEGVTTAEVRKTVPGWTVWTHPTPGGESAEQVGARLDHIVARARAADGPTLVFAHGHSLRVLTARWLGLPATEGRLFRIDTATVSVLGYERESPVVLRLNS